MTEQDNERFMALLIPLSSVYGVEMPEEQIVGYWVALKPYLSIDEFERAVGLAMANLKWFPKPVELIEMIKPSKSLQAWEIFSKVARGYVRNSIDFQDKTINATVRSLGGLKIASDKDPDTFYTFYRKAFLEAYTKLERDGLNGMESGPLLLRGYHEGDGPLPRRGIACGYIESNTQPKIGVS